MSNYYYGRLMAQLSLWLSTLVRRLAKWLKSTLFLLDVLMAVSNNNDYAVLMGVSNFVMKS